MPNETPNIRITNAVPSIRAVNSVPDVRVSAFQTGRSGEVILAGTPIGLLLVLTYANQQAVGTSHGERPNIRII